MTTAKKIKQISHTLKNTQRCLAIKIISLKSFFWILSWTKLWVKELWQNPGPDANFPITPSDAAMQHTTPANVLFASQPELFLFSFKTLIKTEKILIKTSHCSGSPSASFVSLSIIWTVHEEMKIWNHLKTDG